MKQFPVMTAVMAALVVIAAAVGGAVVIWGQPGALSFQEYLDDLKVFALAVAGLGGARGLIAAAQHLAEAIKPPAAPTLAQTTATSTGNTAAWSPANYVQLTPKPAAKKPAVKKPPPRGK